MTNTVETVLSAAAVVLQALLAVLLLVGAAAIWSARARRVLTEARDSLLGSEVWAAWVVALVATSGSLFFSEHAHFVPCHLCWLQRIGMYPLAAILLVAALRRDARGAAFYGLPLAIYGAGVAIYHVYLEHNPGAQPLSCKAGAATCATKWFEKAGYVTIPVLALTAFLTIIALLSMALSRPTPSQAT